MRRCQARGPTDRAVDIDDEVARSAYEMVMVVPDSPLIARDGPGRLDAPDESDFGEGVQRIVDSLMGDSGKMLADGPDDGLSVRVRLIADRVKHGHPLFRHTQGTRPQTCGRVLMMSDLIPAHSQKNACFF